MSSAANLQKFQDVAFDYLEKMYTPKWAATRDQNCASFCQHEQTKWFKNTETSKLEVTVIFCPVVRLDGGILVYFHRFGKVEVYRQTENNRSYIPQPLALIKQIQARLTFDSDFGYIEVKRTYDISKLAEDTYYPDSTEPVCRLVQM